MNIFVDGSNGTAGILLMDQLKDLQSFYDFNIHTLDCVHYKEENARYNAIKAADIAILCLPENIALKTMQDLSDIDTIIIDVSPAHRIENDWTYGFQELSFQNTQQIKNSKRIANPGCFATGMIALLNPLKDYLNPLYPLVINGVTGYSAGGKNAINKQHDNPIGYRATNLNKIHRHMPEVLHITQLKNKIMFNPGVGNFARGQIVQLTIFQDYLHNLNLEDVKMLFSKYYDNCSSITVKLEAPSFLAPETMSGHNNMEVYVMQPENSDFVQLIAMYDNLGKGATGSVIQTLKLLLEKNM